MQQAFAGQYKRKYPRRVFYGSVGILIHGHYFVSECTTLSEGGLSFLHETPLAPEACLVLTFKIPDNAMLSVRGEIKNSRKNKTPGGKSLIFGIQFLPLPIGEKRRIRAYVSARSEDEPIL